MVKSSYSWFEDCQRVIRDYGKKSVSEQKTSFFEIHKQIAEIINGLLINGYNASEHPWRMWPIIRRAVIEVIADRIFNDHYKPWSDYHQFYQVGVLQNFMDCYGTAMLAVVEQAEAIAQKTMKLNIEDERLLDARSLTI